MAQEPHDLKELQAAHKEWRPAGIREITDKPGHYMFSRAIVTPKDPPQLVVPKKMIQKQLIPSQTRIRKPPSVTVGSSLTVASDTETEPTANPALKPPAQVPKNAFFSLEERITPAQNLLSRTQPSTPKTTV
jgi:hypothetical protein